MSSDETSRSQGPGSSAPPPEGAEQIDREIERLAGELSRARAAADESFLSLNESGALMIIGALGVLGSAWVTARLLQQVLPPEVIAHTDFMAGTLRSIQRGLGERGAAVAVWVGWLILAGLTGLHLWQRLGGEVKPRIRPLWLAWVLGIVLVTLPFYEFQAVAAPVSLPMGLAIVLGIYTVVALLQRSDPLTRFFAWLGDSWFGALFGGATLLLILVGGMIPSPRTLLAGILLASCLSLKALLLGIQKLARAREIDSLSGRIAGLLEQRARDEEKRRVRQELDRFINPGTAQPV